MKVDLVLFMGQSNIAGRGVAEDAPRVAEGHGFEFRAITDPTRLYPVTEPFGVNENKDDGITEETKTGSLVSAFINEYYSITKVPIVAVSASKGGSSID
ncbi:sialate O-acetylesterase [Alkalihalobacillus sp. NPDC078783]